MNRSIFVSRATELKVEAEISFKGVVGLESKTAAQLTTVKIDPRIKGNTSESFHFGLLILNSGVLLNRRCQLNVKSNLLSDKRQRHGHAISRVRRRVPLFGRVAAMTEENSLPLLKLSPVRRG